jgi:hypothetical protein
MDLYGLKEDSMEAAKLGASVLAGAAVAKYVVSMIPASVPAPEWIKPLVPIAVGIALHSYGKGRYPIAAPGAAAGMVAFGVAGLVKAVAGVAKQEALVAPVTSVFAGIDTYDSPMLGGFGYNYGAGVDAYMHGAPTQIQQLMGAPVQVQALGGMSSAGFGSSAVLQ